MFVSARRCGAILLATLAGFSSSSPTLSSLDKEAKYIESRNVVEVSKNHFRNRAYISFQLQRLVGRSSRNIYVCAGAYVLILLLMWYSYIFTSEHIQELERPLPIKTFRFCWWMLDASMADFGFYRTWSRLLSSLSIRPHILETLGKANEFLLLADVYCTIWVEPGNCDANNPGDQHSITVTYPGIADLYNYNDPTINQWTGYWFSQARSIQCGGSNF
jgi:hypothetical protein